MKWWKYYISIIIIGGGGLPKQKCAAAGGDSLGNDIKEEASESGNFYFNNKRVAYKANCAYRISGGGYPAFGKFIDFINEHLKE